MTDHVSSKVWVKLRSFEGHGSYFPNSVIKLILLQNKHYKNLMPSAIPSKGMHNDLFNVQRRAHA